MRSGQTAVDAACEGEVQMAPSVSLEVPGYSGRGVAVDRGSRIRITDVRGSQIGDLFALVRDDPHEYLCTARTRALTQRLFPTVGQQFFTNRYRPILTFVSDESPGIHDTLFASCDPGLHELLGGGADHPNCHENFLAVASELGIDLGFVPGPVNLFQNTPVQSDGRLTAERAPAKAGDAVDLRAELDLYLILTACSVDIGVDINGGESTPLQIEVFDSSSTLS
jgi:uncharacterized protein YcgI (DUF1989 family)